MPSRPGKVRFKSDLEEIDRSGLLLPARQPFAPIDLEVAFGNDSPVEVEIGPGKGTFLLRRASQRQDINFLGIEWVASYARYIADRALRAGAGNVRMVAADAEAFFRNALSDKSIWRVHIYFPDPWPKKKHLRRRLIKLPFLHEVRRVLRIGGWLGIVTDHADYFQQVRRLLPSVHGLARAEFPRPADGPGLVGSNFERKYLRAGRPFHALAALRYA